MLSFDARFTVGAQEGFLIDHGEIKERIKGVVISDDALEFSASLEKR
jgi:predicted Zn-dependent protease